MVQEAYHAAFTTTQGGLTQALGPSENHKMTPTIWVAVGAVVAALVAALISRGIKISEFRQAWIDGLRADIADFLSKSYEWIEQYIQVNSEDDQQKKADLADALNRIKYDAFHVLSRIELRFKPDDKQANSLLSALKDLLDPSKLSSDAQHMSWRKLADDATMEGRELLKEEWEITKNPLLRIRKPFFKD